jgi:tetratricopeptide (TPR) repeat protein
VPTSGERPSALAIDAALHEAADVIALRRRHSEGHGGRGSWHHPQVPTRALLAIVIPASLALAGVVLPACGGATSAGGAARIDPSQLPPVDPRALRAFQEGVRDMERGGRAAERSARESFEEALELDPNLWEAHYNLGVLHRRAHRLRQAATSFEAARAIQPGSSEVLAALAETRYALGERDAAAELLRAYVAQHPDSIPVRVELTTVLRERGDHDGALEQAREVLIRDPRNVRALAEIGRIYRAREQYDVAELVIRKAIEITDGAELHNDLGLIQLARGDTQAAFEEFARAIAIDARFAPAHLNQGAVLMRAGDYAGASTEYRAVLVSDPNNLEARVALGAALRGQGEHQDARREYEEVLEASPDHPGALFNLAVLLADFLDQRPRARELFVRFLEAAPAGTYRDTAQRYVNEIPAPAADGGSARRRAPQ